MNRNEYVPPSVLIVEDSPLHARILMTMLSEIGIPDYKVGSAARLQDALTLIRSWQPDCVLLDLTLPDAEGIESVHAVIAAAPEIPVIVVSAHDDPEVAVAAVEAGAQEFMRKWPADAEALGALVDMAMARRVAADSSSDDVTPAAAS